MGEVANNLDLSLIHHRDTDSFINLRFECLLCVCASPSAMRSSPPGVYLAQLSLSASLLTSYASWPSFFSSPWLALICKMDIIIIIVALHVINNLIFIILMLIYVEYLKMWRAKNSARNIATHKIVVIFVITNEKSEASGMVTWLPSYLKADCFSSTR